MWVDDQVRTDTFLCERHVLLLVRHADCALLPVSGRELVTDLRDTNRTDLHLGEQAPFFVCRENNRVNHAHLGMLDLCGAVFTRLEKTCCCLYSRTELLSILVEILHVSHSCSLADNDVVAVNDGARCDDAIEIKLVVAAKSTLLRLPVVWLFKDLLLVLGV